MISWVQQSPLFLPTLMVCEKLFVYKSFESVETKQYGTIFLL